MALMSRDQIHDEVWGFVQDIMSHKFEYRDSMLHHFMVYLIDGSVLVTINCSMSWDPFLVGGMVTNSLTSKASTIPDCDDPLILYTQLVEGVNEQLRSIEWKVNQNERRAVLEGLVTLARGEG